MCEKLDEVLAYHCAPALLGLKAANLVSLDRQEFADLPGRAAAYDRHFRCRGVRFRLLASEGRNFLLLVWHERLLPGQLSTPQARCLLRWEGYRLDTGTEGLLDQLGRRLTGMGEFPHEIGLFLGYPVEDVAGFLVHRGQNCKLCGYWKVYSDVDRALALFRQYDRCREVLYPRILRGQTLSQIFRAA